MEATKRNINILVFAFVMSGFALLFYCAWYPAVEIQQHSCLASIAANLEQDLHDDKIKIDMTPSELSREEIRALLGTDNRYDCGGPGDIRNNIKISFVEKIDENDFPMRIRYRT